MQIPLTATEHMCHEAGTGPGPRQRTVGDVAKLQGKATTLQHAGGTKESGGRAGGHGIAKKKQDTTGRFWSFQGGEKTSLVGPRLTKRAWHWPWLLA